MIPLAGWVAPFGYPRINACSRLPMAFRSVPRPSSPPGAKASTECPSRARDPAARSPRPKPTEPNRQPTMHRSQPHPGDFPDCAAPPHGRHELSTHTGSHRSSHRPIPTPLNACARSRGSPHLPCHHGRRTCRSDTATTARPATHQNLIHPDKDHIRHPTRDTLGAAPAGAAPIRCFTVKRPTPLQTANTLEAIGLEPTTPCLQSRCSPS